MPEQNDGLLHRHGYLQLLDLSDLGQTQLERLIQPNYLRKKHRNPLVQLSQKIIFRKVEIDL